MLKLSGACHMMLDMFKTDERQVWQGIGGTSSGISCLVNGGGASWSSDLLDTERERVAYCALVASSQYEQAALVLQGDTVQRDVERSLCDCAGVLASILSARQTNKLQPLCYCGCCASCCTTDCARQQVRISSDRCLVVGWLWGQIGVYLLFGLLYHAG